MYKNYAVVDIGTLKVKFLIASLSSSGELIEVYSSNTLTCFGCEIDSNNGYVLEKYLQSTIAELQRCNLLMKNYKVAKSRIVSTHAMRRAKNKDEILARIKKEVGFDVENISQEMEAQLFFQAVMRDFQTTNRDYALVDVGGGSVQILVGNKKELKKSHLIQTGAQYLHDNFTQRSSTANSLTTVKDIENMKSYILGQLLPLEKGLKIPIVYGSSNIIDLMRFIGLPLERHEDSTTHPYKTYASHLEKFIKRILPLTYVQREKLFSFQKGYMWGIDKAFLNIVIISKHLKSPYIVPSNANIAQGFIYSMTG